MSYLDLVWLTALVLVAAALLWMAALIVLRMLRTRVGQRQAVERRDIMDALLGLLAGDDTAAARLEPFVAQSRLMGEIVVEFRSLVRGDDHERVQHELRRLGLPAVLAARIATGPKASRLASLEALSALGGSEAEAGLQAALRQGDADIRLTALKGLVDAGATIDLARTLDDLAAGAFGHSRLVAEIIRASTARDPQSSVAALNRTDLDGFARALLIDGLGASGDYSAIPRLLEAARDPDLEARAAVARAAGQLMHPELQPALAILLDDPEWPVRASAAEAVGLAGFTSLAAPLARLLEDPQWWVRFRAGEALCRLGASGAAHLHWAGTGGSPLARHTADLAVAEARAA
jgi:HEAT repeat protein